MLPFSTLLRISRPRFWHYVLGPMLILFAVLSQYADNYIYTSLYKSLDFLLSGEVYMAYITTLQDI
jgi:4-hydroxybenzoate polyprenyltransferase